MIFLQPFIKFADYYGRATRQEFWLFILSYMVIMFITTNIDHILIVELGLYKENIISILTAVGILAPLTAVAIRRLHDINRTGAWVLFFFVPLIGVITLFVFFCLDGNPEENQYGKNPKNAPLDAE